MSKAAKLVEFYKHVLNAIGVQENDDNYLNVVYHAPDGTTLKNPLEIDGKRVVLPTNDNLKNLYDSDLIGFHPLSESIHRGESDVLHLLKKTVEFRLSTVISETLSHLATLLTDKEQHTKMTPKQAAILKDVPTANDRSRNDLNKLLNKHSGKIIKCYLQRDGVINDDTYRRVFVANFPMYDALVKDDNLEVMGVKFSSKKSKKAVIELFEYVLPDLNDGGYRVGSDSSTAPYFHALMKGYGLLSKELNSLIHLYRKYIPMPDNLKSDVSYMEELDSIDKWKGVIDPLPGNKGAVAKGDTDETTDVNMSGHLNNAATTRSSGSEEPTGTIPVSGTSTQPTTPANPTVPTGNIPVSPAPTQPAAGNQNSGSKGGGVSWKSNKPNPTNQNPMMQPGGMQPGNQWGNGNQWGGGNNNSGNIGV